MGAAGAGEKIYIEDVFSTWLYTGEGTGTVMTVDNGIDLAGKGGMVWLKARNTTFHHELIDTVRGTRKAIRSNTTAAQVTNGDLGEFTSSGFKLGGAGSAGFQVGVGDTYTSWTFRKAAKFFDVVTYTGNGVAGRTIAHNLGSVPGLIIVKCTSTGGTAWAVYHRSLASAATVLELDKTAAAFTYNPFWNSTAPTSSVFTVGSHGDVNANAGTYVAYLFAHDAGGFGDSGNDNVISCGSYTGNGSLTGPVIDLGWEPQWLLVKSATLAQTWYLVDTMRGLNVSSDAILQPNFSDAEFATNAFSPLATGFQPTANSNAVNANGQTYIYIAIRRGPMRTPTDATKVFDDLTYTQSSPTFQATNFVTDFVWTSYRNTSGGFFFGDRLRGGTRLAPNSTAAEAGTTDFSWDSNTSYRQSLNSGGSAPVIDYAFRRAPGFFDVVAYTGTGSATTVSHNLGVAPELMVVKRRNDTSHWITYSKNISIENYLGLNSVGPENSGVGTWPWNDTAPTGSVFNLGYDASVVPAFQVNTSGATYIAYLFATCPGVSKVGSYTGTGTTLSIDCGFTAGARFVLIKRTNSTGGWYVWDTARGIVSGNDPYLLLNSTAVEVTNTDYIDPLNSGFEISSTAPAAINANGGSFIFLAIA